MKNDEGVALPLELERRLKLAVDRLGQVRQTLEELDRNADAIRPMLGVRLPRGRGKAATAGPAMKSAGRPAAAPPPAKETRTQPSASQAQAAQEEEIPEWRKLFPGLSAQHPKRK